MSFIEPIEWETEEELFTIFISYIPYYGAFNVSNKLLKLTKEPGFTNQSGIVAHGGHAQISLRFRERLVNFGYAIRRFDIIRGNKVYIELTEQGRKLKQLGSIEAYTSHRALEAAESDLQKKREKRMYLINFWIAVGAIAAIMYYILDLVYRTSSVFSFLLGTLVCTFLTGASLGVVIWGVLSKLKSKDK